MEQFNVVGLPALNPGYSVRYYPTADGSFYMLYKTSDAANYLEYLYYIRRSGDVFTYESTVASTSRPKNSSYPRGSISANIENTVTGVTNSFSGFYNDSPIIVFNKRNLTSEVSGTVYSTNTVYVISLAGAGSIIQTFDITHNYGNAYPSRNFSIAVNSDRGSIVYLIGSTLYERLIEGSLVVSTSLSLSTSYATYIMYGGNSSVAIVPGQSTIATSYRTSPSEAPSQYSTVIGNRSSGESVGLFLNTENYRVVAGSGTSKTFYQDDNADTSPAFARTYAEADATLPWYVEVGSTTILGHSRHFLFRQEGIYYGTMLYLRHIAGAYLLSIELFDSVPGYNVFNVAAIPGSLDVNTVSISIFGTNVYAYGIDITTNLPSVVKVEVGDYSGLSTQNSTLMSLIPGEAVEQSVGSLMDYMSRSIEDNELRFYSVRPDNTAGTYPLVETTIEYTDTTLQRKQRSLTKQYGDVYFSQEIQRLENTLSFKAVASVTQYGPRTNFGTNLNMPGSSYRIAIGSGSGIAANRTLMVTLPGIGGPQQITVNGLVYPASQIITCPFTGNLYILYTSSSSLAWSYVDTKTWTVINNGTAASYPILVVPTAEDELTMYASTVSATGAISAKRVINTRANTQSSVAATNNDVNQYGYQTAVTTNRSKVLNFQHGQSVLWRGYAATANQDNFAYVTKGVHVAESLVRLQAFGEKWYYLKTYATNRPTAVSNSKYSQYHAVMKVSLHNGQEPERWSLQQFSEDVAFLYESWPDHLKITPFMVYTPEDTDFEGVPIPIEPETTIKLRLYGWLNGG